MKRVVLFLVVLFALVGCSDPYGDHLAEGDALLAAGKFDLALKSYEMALKEKTDGKEAKGKIALLEDYEALQALMDEGKLDEAKKLADDLLANEDMVESLKEEVEVFLVKIEETYVENEKIANELNEVEKLLEKKDINEAKLLLKEVEEEYDVTHTEKRVVTLTNAIDKAEKRKAAEEKKAAEKERLAQEEEKKASSYGQYIQKYNETDAYVKAHLNKDTESDIYSHTAHAVGKWDDLLNEVWGVLKTDLPSGGFETLKAEQIEWIKQKEKRIDEIMDPNGGTIVRLDAMSYTMTVTQERTKYLIDNYMK